MSSCKLSIIVLNYNAGTLLTGCLESIFASGISFPFEVIVPDNVSTDSSLELAERQFGDRIRVIRNSDNRGFSAGNNVGIRAARGEYVCLLNPDTIVHPGCFTTLISFLDAHPRAACIGPKVLSFDGSYELAAKRSIPSPFDAVCRALLISRIFPKSDWLARYNLTYLDPEASQKVDASAGCCMLLRREALEHVGLFDEGFFLYCEDVDWFLRAKQAGWEVWYVPSAVIRHYHAYTARFRKHRAVADFHRSMIRFYRKHYSGSYPRAVNGLMYAGVWARMCLVVVGRSLRGWE